METVMVGQAVYFDHCKQWTFSEHDNDNGTMDNGKTVTNFAYNLIVPDAHTLYQLQHQAPTPAPTPPTQAPTPAPAPAPAPPPGPAPAPAPVRGELGWQRPNKEAAKDRYC
jgi:hypothetical protein